VKGAVKGNYGAVKDPKGAVISAESSREGSAGPGNPGTIANIDQSVPESRLIHFSASGRYKIRFFRNFEPSFAKLRCKVRNILKCRYSRARKFFLVELAQHIKRFVLGRRF
jgi:hypothetical protein